jgi:LysM repeat protein
MPDKDSPQSVIDSYQKRQKMLPFLVGGLAVLLVAVGVIVLIIWLTGSGGAGISLFATSTPTPTETFTPTPVTPTSTPTETVTLTQTPTVTITFTPTGPQEYTVQQNDNCWSISQKFKVDFAVLLAINNFGSGCPINPGQKILIPTANQTMPTVTALASDIVRGTKITYIIQLGDTLDSIAARFQTTKELIILDNKITDANTLFAGQTLIIKYGMATPTLTRVPTSTTGPTSAATNTPVPSAATSTQAVATLPTK